MRKAPSPALVLALIIVVLAVAVLNELSQQQPQGENAALQSQYATVTLFPQNAKPLQIKAEVASTEEQIARGLMFRKSLGANEGMLFVFTAASVQNFWMKNTLIPLDMVFIAENRTIVKIHHAVPCTSDPCQLYSSERPAKYVLEVDAGFAANNYINEGSKVTFQS